MKINQVMYHAHIMEARANVAKFLRDPKVSAAIKKARAVNREEWQPDHPLVKTAIRELIKAGLLKAGVTTATGYNFFDLRGPAYLLYPVNTPLVESIPKAGRVNEGYGTAAHWKGTRNPNVTNVYAGVLEGQRNATSTPDEQDYLAIYKELGMERALTFTAEFASEGYTDVNADEHLRGLQSLRLQEEMMTLLGNSGPSSTLGFVLGQAPTPVGAPAQPAGAGLPTGTNVSAAVVCLTGMAMNRSGQGGYGPPPTVANGLTPSYVRTNADNSQVSVNGGTSAISAMSAVVVTTVANGQVTFRVTNPPKGTVGYAWFINTTDAANPSLANAKLAAITSSPVFTVAAVAGGAQTGAALGLNVDSSFEPKDFDGLLTLAATKGTWIDMGGKGLTPNNNGTVAEFESDLQFLWTQFQATPTTLFCSADVKQLASQAILATAGGPQAYRFQYERDNQNNLLGGFVVSAYQSAYTMSPTGSDAIPIRIHPSLPAGTYYWDISVNPYPHSRIPAVREFLAQRDYYSIEWPVVSRQWTFGTYVHEVLAHYTPWITLARAGIGAGITINT